MARERLSLALRGFGNAESPPTALSTIRQTETIQVQESPNVAAMQWHEELGRACPQRRLPMSRSYSSWRPIQNHTTLLPSSTARAR